MEPTSEKPRSFQPGMNAMYQQPDPRRKSPFYAACLSFLPGAGQIYVGYYQRGFLFIIIVGSLISLLESGAGHLTALLGIFLLFFFIFNLIDAHRRATFYNMALEGLENIELPDDGNWKALGGSYVGGVTLVLFGAIALSNTLFGISLLWVESWWPLAPLAFGTYLVYMAYKEQQSSKTDKP